MQLLLGAGADSNNIREGLGVAALKGNASICNQLLKASADANPDCKAQFGFNDEMRV